MLLTLIPLALAGDPLPAPTVELGGFVETYVAHNFNNPANGVTNLRGFDARSDTFALSLASVSVGLKHKFFATKVALQVGPTAASYFGAEPTTASGFGVASTSAANLQFVREAWAGGTAPVLGGLTFEGGVFLSPVGYDSIAVKDNHFWSLSNLGVGLPFYFTGARVRQDFGQGTVLTVACSTAGTASSTTTRASPSPPGRRTPSTLARRSRACTWAGRRPRATVRTRGATRSTCGPTCRSDRSA